VDQGKEVEMPDRMATEQERLLPPSKLLLLAELRALFELATGLSLVPVLLTAPTATVTRFWYTGFAGKRRFDQVLQQYLKWLDTTPVAGSWVPISMASMA
jgi:hypothetical protein